MPVLLTCKPCDLTTFKCAFGNDIPGYMASHIFRDMRISCLAREAYQLAILTCCTFISPFASAYLQFLWTCRYEGKGPDQGFHNVVDMLVPNAMEFTMLPVLYETIVLMYCLLSSFTGPLSL